MVVDLHAFTATYASVGAVGDIGRKAVGLAKLRHAGLRTPDALVVTTHGFLAHVANVMGALPAADAIVSKGALFASRLARHPLPPQLVQQLAELLVEKRWGGRTLAVRSSSSVEDLPDASMAGAFASVVAVEPSDVGDAILTVFASAFADGAVAACLRAGVH